MATGYLADGSETIELEAWTQHRAVFGNFQLFWAGYLYGQDLLVGGERPSRHLRY
jgi:hypothetical protein